MKTTLILAAAASLFVGPVAVAEKDDHDHDHHHAMVGPNGGRVLHEVDPHAELLVTKDRKLQVTFLNEEGKAIAAGDQSVAVICGKRTAPTKMKFTKKEGAFISDKALPKGMNIPTVVQIAMKPGEKKTTIRLNLNLEDCPTCDSLEYACTCDHSEDEKEGDKKKK